MKALFYDPYLDTAGGGERYLLTFAESLLDKGWKVDLIWHDETIKNKLESRLNRRLDGISFVNSQMGLWKKLKQQKKYDLIFWISDGSIPLLFAKKNFLHFQVPFHNVPHSMAEKYKLSKINKIICNSKFTKTIIDKEYGVNSIVIYPPIDIDDFKPLKKENIILSVGRFSQLLQSKRQDVLISVFKKLVDGGLKNWKLVLIGGSDVGADEYLEKLKSQAKDYPVEIFTDLGFSKVKEFYGQAKIFWTASGFDIEEENHPEKVEHFGMTVVEAMASGCLTFAYNRGGHKEIITDKENGFLWNSEDELIELTKRAIADKNTLEKLTENALESSKQFSRDEFIEKFNEIC